MTTLRFRALLAAVAVVFGAVGAFLFHTAGGSAPRERFAFDQTTFTHTRITRVSGGRPVVIHHLPVRSHGGTMAIEWYDPAWSPLKRLTGSYAGIYVDGVERSSGLIGGYSGDLETRPAVVMWTGELTPGRHVVEVRVVRADGGFALPKVDHGRVAVDGLYVTEYTR